MEPPQYEPITTLGKLRGIIRGLHFLDPLRGLGRGLESIGKLQGLSKQAPQVPSFAAFERDHHGRVFR